MTPDRLDPSVWISGLILNLGLAAAALRLGAVDWTGAVGGAGYGLAIYLALGWRGFLVLALFVALGSGFTRVGRARKQKLGAAEARGGRRTWRNATANCLIGALAALGAAVGGLAPAVAVTAFAAALADTSESELGMLAGRRAWLLPRLKPVPAGTEGAVSAAGCAIGLLAAALLLAVGAGVGLVDWRQVPALALAAFAATLLESLVAAERTLNNEALNLLVTASAALFAVWISG